MLHQASRFSLTMHGAALLYNLLVAERYEAMGYTRVEQPEAYYREALDTWADDIRNNAGELQRWDREALWRHVLDRNPRILQPTQLFVKTWTAAVLDGTALTCADSPQLRQLVSERERRIKKGQSRLVNDKLLGAWAGESGAGLLTFRWGQVRRMVTDIQQGLATSASS